MDRRQLKHRGELNPALHEYRVNHLAHELQLLASQSQPHQSNPPSSLNSPSTPALGPSQYLELLANAMSSGNSTNNSNNNKGNSKAFSKDSNSDATRTKQFSTHTGGEGVNAAVHIKQEGEGIMGQSSKYTLASAGTALTPQNSPTGHQGGVGVGGGGGSLAKLKAMERLKTDHSGAIDFSHTCNNNSGGSGTGARGIGVPDTPLTHFRTAGGGEPATATAFVTCTSSSSLSSGQKPTSSPAAGRGGGSGTCTSSGTCNSHHPLLLASSTMASGAVTCKSEGHTSGQQASAQTGGTGVAGNRNSHVLVCAKGPVTRSTAAVRASSPSTSGDAQPLVSGSPDKNAKSAEKPHGTGVGLSSEEARKLRQAQQRLQKEQWMKKYGQGGTKRLLEMQSSGVDAAGESAGSGSDGDGSGSRRKGTLSTGAEAMENGVLISDGKLMVL